MRVTPGTFQMGGTAQRPHIRAHQFVDVKG